MKRTTFTTIQWVITLLLMSILVFKTSDTISQDQTIPLERIEIPFSINPVVSGARALGMGNAFIAIADDATSASWNPGGLRTIYRC